MFRPANLVVAASATLAATLFATAAHAAPVTFAVDVDTGDVMPTSRMKVVLWGAYTPGVSVSVTAGGSTGSAALPSGTDSAAIAFGGDLGKVTHSGNALIVDLKLFSVVKDPTNQCEPLSPVAGVKQYSFTVTGGGTVTNRGLSAYSATSEINCVCSTRRRATGADWHAGSLPPGTARRIPFSVVSVLDESGSMLSPPQGGAGSSKWKLTTEAFGEFVDTLNMETDDPGDRQGLVFFDGTVSPFLNGVSPWYPKSSFASLKTEVDAASHPRAGSTTIGGGLQFALEVANCNEPDPLPDPVILLMSDGMQNTMPLVNDGTGADLGHKTLKYATACPTAPASRAEQRLTNPCIPVLSVYVDLPAGTPAATLLQAISDQTAGTNASRAQLSSDPPAAFGGTLVNMLKGSTLSLLGKTKDSLSGDSPTGTPLTVTVDGTVKRVIVLLGWEPTHGFEQVLTLGAGNPDETTSPELRRALAKKAATAVKTNAAPAPQPKKTVTGSAAAKLKLKGRSAVGGRVAVQDPAFYLVRAANMEPSSSTTDLTFYAARTHPYYDGPTPPAVPYHLFVYAVESQLEFIPRFTAGRHGTGQPLVLNLDLALDHKPLAGNGGSVQVSVDGPTGAIGTLLHDLKDPGGTSAPGEAPKESPADKKINNLNGNADVLAKTLPKDLGQPISFTDKGKGHYQVILNEPKVPGAYVFHLTLDVPGPSGTMHRIEDVETQVEVLPTATTVSVNKLPDQTYQVQVVPLDKYKNYLGPGFEGQIQLSLPQGVGKIAAVADANVDGSYAIHVVDVPPGVDPAVELFVAGTSVAKGPLTHLGEPGGSNGTGGSPGTGGASGTGGTGPVHHIGCCGAAGSVSGMGPTFPVVGASLLGLGFAVRRRRRSSDKRDT